jgi:hypothetical protein
MASSPNGWLAPVFVYSFFFLSNYLLLSLLVAVILNALELSDSDIRSRQADAFKELLREAQLLAAGNVTSAPPVPSVPAVPTPARPSYAHPRLDAAQMSAFLRSHGIAPVPMLARTDSGSSAGSEAADEAAASGQWGVCARVRSLFRTRKDSVVQSELHEIRAIFGDGRRRRSSVSASPVPTELSRRSSSLRLAFQKALHSKWFSRSYYVFYLASVTTLAFKSLFPPTPLAQALISAVDVAVFGGFLLLLSVRVGADLDPHSLVRSPPFLIDAIILLLSGADVIPHGVLSSLAQIHGGAVEEMVGLYLCGVALRPVRLFAINGGVMAVSKALSVAMVPILHVLGTELAILFIFAIAAVKLFNGRMWTCTSADKKDAARCIGLASADGFLRPNAWVNRRSHFDTSLASLRTLFEMMTLSDVDVVMAQLDAAGAPAVVPFFVIFVLVCGFLLARLFVGIVLLHFSAASHSSLLTDRQRMWVDIQKTLQTLRIGRSFPPPLSRLRVFAVRVVSSRRFEAVVSAAIAADVALMAASRSPADETTDVVLAAGNLVAIGIFLTEMALRFGALTWRHVKHDGWLLAEAFVIATSALSPFVGAALKPVRVVRLLLRTERLRRLLHILLISLPQISNVLLFMVAIFATFSAATSLSLSSVKFQRRLTFDSNFRSFFEAVSANAQLMTMSSWGQMMYDAAIDPPLCSSRPLDAEVQFVHPPKTLTPVQPRRLRHWQLLVRPLHRLHHRRPLPLPRPPHRRHFGQPRRLLRSPGTHFGAACQGVPHSLVKVRPFGIWLHPALDLDSFSL